MSMEFLIQRSIGSKMRKKTIEIIILIILVSCSKGENVIDAQIVDEHYLAMRKQKVKTCNKYGHDVSIIQLIANPEKYKDVRIITFGFLSDRLEDRGLYVSKEYYDYHISNNKIGIVWKSSREELQKYVDRYVLVRGIFRVIDKTEYYECSDWSNLAIEIEEIWDLESFREDLEKRKNDPEAIKRKEKMMELINKKLKERREKGLEP